MGGNSVLRRMRETALRRKSEVGEAIGGKARYAGIEERGYCPRPDEVDALAVLYGVAAEKIALALGLESEGRDREVLVRVRGRRPDGHPELDLAFARAAREPVLSATARAVSNSVARARCEKGLRQDAFAAACGVSEKAARAIEKGEACPSLELALRMSEVLGVGVNDLFRRVDEGPLAPSGRASDLSGCVFGPLEVIGRAEPCGGRSEARWRCRCRDCGETVVVRADRLIEGRRRHRGCLCAAGDGRRGGCDEQEE